jgi:putative copper export protein
MTDDSHVLAQSVHDLGAALWFGGAVMGVAGVNKSGNDLRDGLDKVRVASSAWSRFAPVEWSGVAAVLLAGTQLTRASKGRLATQHGWARAGGTKAAIAAAGAVATGYAAYSGSKIGKLAEQAASSGRPVDVQDASQPNAQTPPEIAAWQRRQRLAQYAVPLLAGANIVLNSYLVQTYRPGATAKGLLKSVL